LANVPIDKLLFDKPVQELKLQEYTEFRVVFRSSRSPMDQETIHYQFTHEGINYLADIKHFEGLSEEERKSYVLQANWYLVNLFRRCV
jgi:hypothetical protein